MTGKGQTVDFALRRATRLGGVDQPVAAGLWAIEFETSDGLRHAIAVDVGTLTVAAS